MKKVLLILLLLIYTNVNAQIVNIPDVNFKNALVSADTTNYIATDINGNSITIDTNGDGEIQFEEVLNIYSLSVINRNIFDLAGIEEFINLTNLRCENNQLSNLDISNNTNLSNLNCQNNQLNSLDVSNNTNLSRLLCYRNQLSSLDISNNIALTDLESSNNNISTLDVSNNIALTILICSSNNISTLDVSNNTNLRLLFCRNNQLSNIDVSNNINLIKLRCSQNQLTTLDVNNNTDLTTLECQDNQLSNLDVSNNTNLFRFGCSNNQLSSLDVSNHLNLTRLFCSDNLLTSLDVSNLTSLFILNCNDNPDLSYINLKNGIDNYLNISSYGSNFQNLPNLQSLCVDELNTALTAFISTEVAHPVTFTEYCSFNPAQSNDIAGVVSVDLDLNGCDVNDFTLPNMLVVSDNGTTSYATFSQSNGSYQLYTDEGIFTTSLTTNLPSYFTATPNFYNHTFTGFNNTYTATFCVAPNQTINDVNISLIPINQARPGFNTRYQVVYTNVGTTRLNGDISVTFNDTKLSFLNASETINTQTSNSLSFNYANLRPFETRTINLVFNVNAPTAIQPTNIGDILNFATTINPISGDYTEGDNIFTLNQTVIGSYDPNDITCLEGDEILLEDTDKYLHYIIRFQNSGTASAINIVVKNILDAKLDWSTLELETSSHSNRVAIKNGNEIEFIFENIHLPDETTDEPNSHGFIAYKIKPKSDVVLGNIFPNTAGIFFDYNEAIVTNTATTEIVSTLAVNENSLLNFSIYPIPTTGNLEIESKTAIVKIEIYNKFGQRVLKNTNKNNIDISNLSEGLYICKIEDVNGSFGIRKVIKK